MPRSLPFCIEEFIDFELEVSASNFDFVVGHIYYLLHHCPVDWGFKIHRLRHFRGVRPPPNECPVYDTKQSDAKVPVMLGFWGMQSTPSLLLLPGPLWPEMVARDRALSMG